MSALSVASLYSFTLPHLRALTFTVFSCYVKNSGISNSGYPTHPLLSPLCTLFPFSLALFSYYKIGHKIAYPCLSKRKIGRGGDFANEAKWSCVWQVKIDYRFTVTLINLLFLIKSCCKTIVFGVSLLSQILMNASRMEFFVKTVDVWTQMEVSSAFAMLALN